MSRLNSPAPVVVEPTNNVYTALALVSFLASLGALVYMLYEFHTLGLLFA